MGELEVPRHIQVDEIDNGYLINFVDSDSSYTRYYVPTVNLLIKKLQEFLDEDS